MEPFTVAWRNPNKPQPSDGRELVTCEICKKKGLPFDPWTYYELPVKGQMYEYLYWVCSDECDKKATTEVKKKRIKELS